MHLKLNIGQSGQPGINQLGGQLCIALAICGYFSVTAAHHLSGIGMYAFGTESYPTVLCLFYHQHHHQLNLVGKGIGLVHHQWHLMLHHPNFMHPNLMLDHHHPNFMHPNLMLDHHHPNFMHVV